MRVLKVSEINNGIDQLINKKKEEKRQILAIHDAMEKVINLDDALKGEGVMQLRITITCYIFL